MKNVVFRIKNQEEEVLIKLEGNHKTVILIRLNLDNNESSFPKQNKTFDLTNDIFLDERRLLKSRQVHELMDRMIGRVKPPSPPKEA